MLLHSFFVLLSLALLYFGAEWLIKGASSFALRVGMSPLVVGLTIVAYGTSMPELLVSVQSTLAGQGDIAIGNVIGSNIFNVCVILGISAIISPLLVQRQLLNRDTPIMLGALLLFTLFLFYQNSLSRLEGAILLACAIAYTIFCIRSSKKHPEISAAEESKASQMLKHWYFEPLLILLGLILLAVGSNLLVKGSVFLARAWGMSEALIGLTIVAAGTSMPELATSVIAAMRKQNEIALGNIVGSNIFNVLCVAGAAAIVKPIAINNIDVLDVCTMLGASILLLIMLYTSRTLKRWEGLVLFLIYAAYLIYRIVQLP